MTTKCSNPEHKSTILFKFFIWTFQSPLANYGWTFTGIKQSASGSRRLHCCSFSHILWIFLLPFSTIYSILVAWETFHGSKRSNSQSVFSKKKSSKYSLSRRIRKTSVDSRDSRDTWDLGISSSSVKDFVAGWHQRVYADERGCNLGKPFGCMPPKEFKCYKGFVFHLMLQRSEQYHRSSTRNPKKNRRIKP